MSDDLISRAAALAALDKHSHGTKILGGQTYRSITLEVAFEAIRALPAVAASQPSEEVFMQAVWDALKADTSDLGKQRRILTAFRAVAASQPVTFMSPDTSGVQKALAIMAGLAEQVYSATGIAASPPADPAVKADSQTPEQMYLICKYGGYYRPNCQGYTSSMVEAGRYTLAEAEKETHPNGPDGPRDGMSFMPAPAIETANTVKADSQQPVRIKPLVWRQREPRFVISDALSVSAFYRVLGGQGDWTLQYPDGIALRVIDGFETQAAAKAVAQADYEQRILAAIETQPDPRYSRLVAAGNHLSFMAQTSGGTAGRDDALVLAIGAWCDAAQAAAKGGAV